MPKQILRDAETGDSPGRVLWLDNLRGFSCALVVLLHVSAAYLYQFGKISNSSWLVGNAVDSLTRISVPLFFAISGYFFFSDSPPKPKNFVKLIVNIVLYSLLSFAYLLFVEHSNPSEMNFNFFAEQAFYHLWFFYALIPIYIFATLVRARLPTLGISLMAGTTLFLLFNPQMDALLKPFGLGIMSPFSIIGSTAFYIAYAILGASIGRTPPVDGKRLATTIMLAFAALLSSWATITTMTYYETIIAGKLVMSQYNYNSFPVFVGTIAAIVLFKHIELPKPASKALGLLSAYSLPIYGIHALVLDYFRNIRNLNYPLIDIPITFAAVLLISLALAQIIRCLDFGTGIVAPPLSFRFRKAAPTT